MPIFKKPQAPATLEEQIRDAAQRLFDAQQSELPTRQHSLTTTERDRAPSNDKINSVAVDPSKQLSNSMFNLFKPISKKNLYIFKNLYLIKKKN